MGQGVGTGQGVGGVQTGHDSVVGQDGGGVGGGQVGIGGHDGGRGVGGHVEIGWVSVENKYRVITHYMYTLL